MAPLIKAFSILNYSPVIERAVAAGYEKSVGDIKLRLEGCLDLYSLRSTDYAVGLELRNPLVNALFLPRF